MKRTVAIKGPITTPVGTGFRSVNVALRKSLDLWRIFARCSLDPGAGGRYEDVDLVIVRENSEDLYAGIEFEEGTPEAERLTDLCAAEGAGVIRPGSGISIKPISITGSDRIVRFAFDYAKGKHGREKVTAAQGEHREVLRWFVLERSTQDRGHLKDALRSTTASSTRSA